MFPLFKMIAARNSSSGPAPSITSYWSTSAPLPYATRKINVAPGVAKSTGGGACNLEWTIGTKEAYILKIPGGIDSAVVDCTLDNIAAGNMLFVNNYERAAAVSSSGASSILARPVPIYRKRRDFFKPVQHPRHHRDCYGCRWPRGRRAISMYQHQQ